MNFINSWDDAFRAQSYSKMEFPNTYHLAYRDLPEIINRHVTGKRAADFGCGAGRSTRFLKRLGFTVTGMDVASDMLDLARSSDPGGIYLQVTDGDYDHLGTGSYDLVQSIFTFDNIPGRENRAGILRGLARLLAAGGKMLLLDSTPEMYTHEWASFTTNEFAMNLRAAPGDVVCTRMLDVDDDRPVLDVFWTEKDYMDMFQRAGLSLAEVYRPLGREDEGYCWISEMKVAPWVIYILEVSRQFSQAGV